MPGPQILSQIRNRQKTKRGPLKRKVSVRRGAFQDGNPLPPTSSDSRLAVRKSASGVFWWFVQREMSSSASIGVLLLCLSLLAVEATVQFVAGGSSNWTYYDDSIHAWVAGAPSGLFNIWFDVVYSPTLDLWVGAGAGVPDLVVSPDGITWQQVVLAVSSCVGVCEGGGSLVAVCNASPSSPSLYRSVDRGVSWIGVGPNGLFVNNLDDGGRCSFSPSQNRFIAAGVGSATLAFSDDLGATWTSLGNIVFDVAAHSVGWSEEQVDAHYFSASVSLLTSYPASMGSDWRIVRHNCFFCHRHFWLGIREDKLFSLWQSCRVWCWRLGRSWGRRGNHFDQSKWDFMGTCCASSFLCCWM
jgi:hypothetical protein